MALGVTASAAGMLMAATPITTARGAIAAAMPTAAVRNMERSAVLVAVMLETVIGLSWIVRVIPSDEHNIAVIAFASIPRLRDLFRQVSPPFG